MHDPIPDPAGSGLIQEGERLDDLQFAGLRILQKASGFRFGMDAVLLADFARIPPQGRVADFGTGSGILPLLLHGRGKGARFDAIEIQPDMADMARRTVRLNGLEQHIAVHCLPVEQAEQAIPACSLDAVICNPPYGPPGTTLLNPSDSLRLARHQGEDGLGAWFRAAHQLLCGKGRFSMVYPAPRMLEAMDALQAARLIPKRFRLIYPFANKPANLVLIEAVKDAKPMLHPEPPLIVYQPDGAMTDELKHIYHIA